jgi:hypothetical protein
MGLQTTGRRKQLIKKPPKSKKVMALLVKKQ